MCVDRKIMAKEAAELLKRYHNFFNKKKYKFHESVFLTSGIDSSVRFIGSHISVLKPYFMLNTIPSEGFHISQKSIRTKNLKIMKDENTQIMWGSYFTNLGVLVQPQDLERLCEDTFKFFESEFKFDSEKMRIRVNSKDQDLLQVVEKKHPQEYIEINTFGDNYYKHKYGIDSVSGRNFNIALKNLKNGGFSDVGNIVIIQNGIGQLGVELGLGDSTILKQIYDLEHVLDVFYMPELDISPNNKRKLEDCIIVSTALYRENLRPSGSNMGQSFRRYLESMSYICNVENLPLNKLKLVMNEFEKNEFGSASSNAGEKAIEKIKYLRKDEPKHLKK
jgi:hypothetical protein